MRLLRRVRVWIMRSLARFVGGESEETVRRLVTEDTISRPANQPWWMKVPFLTAIKEGEVLDGGEMYRCYLLSVACNENGLWWASAEYEGQSVNIVGGSDICVQLSLAMPTGWEGPTSSGFIEPQEGETYGEYVVRSLRDYQHL